jgi:hypothetical protein
VPAEGLAGAPPDGVGVEAGVVVVTGPAAVPAAVVVVVPSAWLPLVLPPRLLEAGAEWGLAGTTVQTNAASTVMAAVAAVVFCTSGARRHQRRNVWKGVIEGLHDAGDGRIPFLT